MFVDPAEIESSSKHSFPGRKEREDRGHASRAVAGVPGQVLRTSARTCS